MERILLVDDDVELTTLLREYLIEDGFAVDATDDGRAAIAAATSGTVDIIVLDVMMPRLNGIDVLQRIRRVSTIPVLMLTAKGDDTDRISGLNLGADDYVPKPSSPGELAARVRAILRRVRRTEQDPARDVLQAGRLTMNSGSRTADWDGQALSLTGTEFSLLETLARSAGQIVSKDELSQQVFGKPLSAFDRRIDVHLSAIRQKLGKRTDGMSWIQSVRGQGYQLLRD